MKKKTDLNATIKTQEDFLKMVASLPATNSNKSRIKVKSTLEDIPSLDTSKLSNLAERIYLAGANIELNILGDVGVFSAALLNRRFKRTGFAGRSINLAIPASVDPQERNLLIDRIGQCVKPESVNIIKNLIQTGTSITMEDAKNHGLIDQVIDLSKRRGAKSANAIVPVPGNAIVPVPGNAVVPVQNQSVVSTDENQIAT